MRYLVTARVKPGREVALLRAIDDGSLGAGSIAGTEYVRNLANARIYDDGRIRWVEVCFCDPPLAEERPYWESHFELLRVQDALNRKSCRDVNGEEPWACSECAHTDELERNLALEGRAFLEVLRSLRFSAQPRCLQRRNAPLATNAA